MQKKKLRRWLAAIAVCAVLAFSMSYFMAASAQDEAAQSGGEVFTVTVDDEEVEYDLSDGDSAHDYIDGYADNLNADESFESHLEMALSKVRESIGAYATAWSLLPPIVAIVLALITKEVYLCRLQF